MCVICREYYRVSFFGDAEVAETVLTEYKRYEREAMVKFDPETRAKETTCGRVQGKKPEKSYIRAGQWGSR